MSKNLNGDDIETTFKEVNAISIQKKKRYL